MKNFDTFKNEYRTLSHDGYVYVSACQEKDANGIWRASTFADDELFHYHRSDTTGIVISASSGYNTIDHASDASLAMIALGMIPEPLDKILCVDRRGKDDVAPDFLDGFVEGGATVLYDGHLDHQPYNPLYPQDAFFKYEEFSAKGYRSKVLYTGSLSDLDINAWKRCYETYAAHQCFHVKELVETGSTIHCQIEELPEDPGVLKQAVLEMSGKKICAPNDIVNWSSLGVTALDQRLDEVEKYCPDTGQGKRIMALAKCWDAVLQRYPWHPRKVKNMFRKWGIDTMLDAFDKGVPLEHIIAE